MSDKVFKRGDKVYHYRQGWGKVVSTWEGKCDVRFECDDAIALSLIIPVNELSFTEYNLIDGGLSQIKPFTLENGGSYKRTKYDSNWLVINRKGDRSNYGVINGNWYDDIPCSDEHWIEATDEEVISALENEACKIFGVNWKNIKLKNDISSSISCSFLNKGIYNAGVEKCYQGYWNVAGVNGFLFYRGTWAEKAEYPEIVTGTPVLVRHESNTWVFSHYSHYESSRSSPYVTTGGHSWEYCIPFNDDTKHLVGTKNPLK